MEREQKIATKILGLPQKVPQITNFGTQENIWEMYRYTFAFKQCSLHVLSATAGDRLLGSKNPWCDMTQLFLPCEHTFFAWSGQKEAADSKQSVPEGTPQLESGSVP